VNPRPCRDVEGTKDSAIFRLTLFGVGVGCCVVQRNTACILARYPVTFQETWDSKLRVTGVQRMEHGVRANGPNGAAPGWLDGWVAGRCNPEGLLYLLRPITPGESQISQNELTASSGRRCRFSSHVSAPTLPQALKSNLFYTSAQQAIA
jgi:hypothetical protein